MVDVNDHDRRRFLKATGVAAAGFALPFSGTAAAGSGDVIDDAFDLSTSGLKEALVVFTSNAQVDRLRHLDLEDGFHGFEVLPIGYTRLTSDQIRIVADWPEVRYVQKNVELEYHNDDARETTGADAVHGDFGYTGSGAHSVVIDSGVDGDHPDLGDDLVHNWRYVNPLSSSDDTTWEDVGAVDSDDNGHGTHCSGSITGSGRKSDGKYEGLAPDADLTVYSAGLTLLIVKPVAAYDHLLSRVRAGETDVQVVSNSWGGNNGTDFDPDDAVNVATWHAFKEGILPVFSAGNSGPGTNTLNQYATAPHVLGVAATDDRKTVTDFSSRGRSPDYDGPTNYDRKKALDNLREYHAADKTETEVDAGSYSGTVDVTGSEYHRWDAPKNAGYVEATLSWTPSVEDLDFYLHEGSKDGDVVASSASLNEPEALAGQIAGGETYYFEVRPFIDVVADYAIEFTAYEGINRDVTPMGLYRNGVGAPGKLVMSTLEPDDPLQAYYEDTETWYGRISGTSMSCPVTAGAATLLVDAYYQNHGEYPDPIDVLNTVEAEAEDVHDSYTVESIGAGFVDAYDAVRRAESGDWSTFGTVKLVDD
ncbi:S8 family serine peptidase [Halomicrococcus sp. NG-SE-24]|uniref:S8 family serine peptidase n=1 Tax=Halomicrococcus sp. NG-SE-24 TaxID=3436928 RepID=UPI003D95B848